MIGTVDLQLAEMAEDDLWKQFAYVTYDDIKKLNDISENKNWTLLAIRAPPGTKLEIPQNEKDEDKEKLESSEMLKQEGNKERGIQTNDKKRYQIMLNSEKGEIMIYLISNDDDKSDDDDPENDKSDDQNAADEDEKDSNQDEENSVSNIQSKLDIKTEIINEKAQNEDYEEEESESPEEQNFELNEEIDHIFSVSNMFSGEHQFGDS